jgi:hypothetical protein
MSLNIPLAPRDARMLEIARRIHRTRRGLRHLRLQAFVQAAEVSVLQANAMLAFLGDLDDDASMKAKIRDLASASPRPTPRGAYVRMVYPSYGLDGENHAL